MAERTKEAFEARRAALGMSQGELAAALGMSERGVSEIARGNSPYRRVHELALDALQGIRPRALDPAKLAALTLAVDLLKPTPADIPAENSAEDAVVTAGMFERYLTGGMDDDADA